MSKLYCDCVALMGIPHRHDCRVLTPIKVSNSYCGAPLSYTGSSNSYCGAPLSYIGSSNTLICSYCGSVAPVNKSNCSQCGAPLDNRCR